MNTLIYYIQVNMFLYIFFMLYFLLLKKETFHVQNRIYLLGAVAGSFLLSFTQSVFLKDMVSQVPEVKTIATSYYFTTVNIAKETASNNLTYKDLLEYLYIIGVALSTIILLVKLVFTIKWIKAIKNKKGIAFSFFGKIFIDKELAHFEVVNQHENIHVRQMHFIDILLFEMLKITFWFNPTVYFYKKAITIIHEFLADESAAKHLEC